MFAVLLRWRAGSRGARDGLEWSPGGARIIVDYCSGRRAWRVCLVEATARSAMTFQNDDNINISVVRVDTPERGLSLARKMILCAAGSQRSGYVS